MKNSVRTVFVFALLVGIVPAATHAHFKLMEPASWIIENERGDPQKAGPCGGTNTDYGKPSFIVTKAEGGSKLHLKIQETIYHPGHYRVALAVNSPLELPLDPAVETIATEKGPRSVSAAIMNPVEDAGARRWPVRPSRPGWTRPSRRTSSCPTSTARSARFRSCSSWRITASTTRADTPIITARSCRLPRTKSKPIDKEWPVERIVP